MPISSSPTLPVKKIPVHIKSAQNRVLIKGGRVVNHDQSFYADVYVEDGIIKDIGENLIVPGGIKTIEARGKLVIPGGIDAHTNLEQVFMGARTVDDFHTGTKAALAGGTTTVLNSIREPSVSLIEAFNVAKERAEKKACCDYSFHICLTGFSEQVAREMEAMVRERGINSFIMYTTYRDLLMLSEDEIIRAIKKCKELGCVAMIHAENGALVDECVQRVKAQNITGPEGHLLSRPEQAEAEAVQRVISIAEELNCPCYFANIVSKSSAVAIANARRRGVIVYAECLTAGLGVDGSHYYDKSWKHSASYVMSPPLRDDPTTPSCLMDMLSNGDLELTSSSHCTFNISQRALGKDDFTRIPHGTNGIEERMSLVWEKGVRSGRMDPCRFVAVTSTNAARLFNMYPRKGRIEKGSDADIVIWDPETVRTVSARTHQSACDVNVLEGMQLHGSPIAVLSNGKVMLEDGAFNVIQGSGRFIERPCYADYVFARVKVRDGVKMRRVDRESYVGEVADAVSDLATELHNAKLPTSPNSGAASIHHRPLTKAGARNLQDSSFTIGGEWDQMPCDQMPINNRSRAKAPPGGKSSVVF